MPTFRRPRQLAQAIESVLAQQEVRTEIHVIDDCPDVSARETVAAFAAHNIFYHLNPHPTGGRPAIVRNLGQSFATGEIVHFLDDDDIVPSGYYRAAKNAFDRTPDVGVIFGKIEPFGDGDIASEKAYFEKAWRRARRCRLLGPKLGFSAAMFFEPTLFICSAAMIRRSRLAEIDGFDPTEAVGEDVEFYACAIRHFGALFLDRVSIHYRIGPSLMRQADPAPVLVNAYRAIQSRYRHEHGSLDFYALKTVSKLLRAFNA
jgi:glycosyltransferase involved in cell wall biosynthesis